MSACPPGSSPLIDVVVLNHDYGRFVGDAIESALGQSYAPARVVVVDDGSQDDSRAVLAAYAGRAEVVLKENGGQASAVNVGFDRCRGDVVVFLDADDLLESDALARIAEVFGGVSRPVRAHYRLRVIDASGRRTGEVRPPSRLPLPSGDLRRSTLTSPFDGPWCAMSGNAFSAGVLRGLLPMPVGAAVGADWYLVHVSSLYGRVAAIDAVLGRYRIHGGNRHTTQASEIDPAHLRATISFAAETRSHLVAHAERLGLPVHRFGMVSMSDVGNRVISWRLDPAAHPVAGEGRLRFALLALRACRLRSDARASFKALFLTWMLVMVAAPRRLALRAATPFLFPDRRPAAPRILRRLVSRVA